MDAEIEVPVMDAEVEAPIDALEAWEHEEDDDLGDADSQGGYELIGS